MSPDPSIIVPHMQCFTAGAPTSCADTHVHQACWPSLALNPKPTRSRMTPFRAHRITHHLSRPSPALLCRHVHGVTAFVPLCTCPSMHHHLSAPVSLPNRGLLAAVLGRMRSSPEERPELPKSPDPPTSPDEYRGPVGTAPGFRTSSSMSVLSSRPITSVYSSCTCTVFSPDHGILASSDTPMHSGCTCTAWSHVCDFLMSSNEYSSCTCIISGASQSRTHLIRLG